MPASPALAMPSPTPSVAPVVVVPSASSAAGKALAGPSFAGQLALVLLATAAAGGAKDATAATPGAAAPATQGKAGTTALAAPADPVLPPAGGQAGAQPGDAAGAQAGVALPASTGTSPVALPPSATGPVSPPNADVAVPPPIADAALPPPLDPATTGATSAASTADGAATPSGVATGGKREAPSLRKPGKTLDEVADPVAPAPPAVLMLPLTAALAVPPSAAGATSTDAGAAVPGAAAAPMPPQLQPAQSAAAPPADSAAAQDGGDAGAKSHVQHIGSDHGLPQQTAAEPPADSGTANRPADLASVALSPPPAAPNEVRPVGGAPSIAGLHADAAATPAAQVAPALVALARAPDGAQRMTLRLQPDELGQVQIRIDRPADGPARVEITVERPETLTLLLHDQPQLQRALDQAGVPGDGRSVTFHIVPAEPGAGTGGQSNGNGGGAANWSGAADGNGGQAGSGGRQGSGQGSGQGGGGGGQSVDPDEPSPRWLRAGLDITA